MTQIPRKPTFPSYMVQKLRAKIQSDVQEDVIPVSTGIYSYEKLKNKLEAIPKPQIQNYQDKIFFEIIEDRLAVVDKTGQKCPSCDQEYNKKNPAAMCNFCAIWCCNNCMPTRKRPHPLSKDGSGKRYNVCQRCDTKYLNLQLGHSYVQNRTLLELAIVKTSQELQNFMSQCQEYQEVLTKSKQTFEKNKFKLSQLRKEKLQLTKQIKSKMPEQIKVAEDKQQELKVKFLDIHLKHKEWLGQNERKKKEKEEKQKQRIRRQRQQQEQRRRIEQQRRKKQQEQSRAQRQRAETYRIEREQEQQANKYKMRKAPSLQQNSTLSMNLSYSNSQTDLQRNNSRSDQEHKTVQNQRINKKNTKDYGGYDSYRREESDQQEQVRARELSKTSLNEPQSTTLNTHPNQQHTVNLLSSQFAQYFRQSQPEQPANKNSVQNNPGASQTQWQQEKIDDFTFNHKPSLRNYENDYQVHQANINRNQTQNKRQGSNRIDQQYTFQNKQLEQEHTMKDLGDQAQEIPISVPNPYKTQQEQEQNNKLSYIDQWYVNKNSTINNSNYTTNQQEPYSSYSSQSKPIQSSLSTALHSPTSTGLSHQSTINHKKNQTQSQLQEQCSKSTSELDQQQLQVARYSLIKAARDNAVEQRQRNKIYQKSIYQTDQAPYDQQQAQGVGQIKKCQCSIY